MTIEKLLGYSTKDLQSMSDEELLKIFQPYLKITHVEHTKKEKKLLTNKPTKDEVNMAKLKANKLAQDMGLPNIF